MRVAPPVQVWSCGAGGWQALQLALVGLSVGVSTLWAGTRVIDGSDALVVGSFGLGLAAAALSRRRLAHAPRRLGWDGQLWTLYCADNTLQDGRVTLMLDLECWMLVRFARRPARRLRPAAAVWLPLRERDIGADWPALRVALYAPQSGDDVPRPAA